MGTELEGLSFVFKELEKKGKIGDGGFGTVYLVKDPNHPTMLYVAKVAKEHHEALKHLYLDEARLLEKLRGVSNVVQFIGFEQGNDIVLYQEYIRGKNLQQYVNAYGLYTETEVWDFFLKMSKILIPIHEQNIIHRDIKPSNIMIRNKDSELVLIDFGASKVMTETAYLHTRTLVGSPAYSAPEQINGDPVFGSDVYAMAGVALFLLTGEAPQSHYSFDYDEWRFPDSYDFSPEMNELLLSMLERSTRRRAKLPDIICEASKILKPAKEVAIELPSHIKTYPNYSKPLPLRHINKMKRYKAPQLPTDLSTLDQDNTKWTKLILHCAVSIAGMIGPFFYYQNVGQYVTGCKPGVRSVDNYARCTAQAPVVIYFSSFVITCILCAGIKHFNEEGKIALFSKWVFRYLIVAPVELTYKLTYFFASDHDANDIQRLIDDYKQLTEDETELEEKMYHRKRLRR